MKREKHNITICAEDLAGLWMHINNMRPPKRKSWFDVLFKREIDEDIQDYIETANFFIKAMADKAMNADSKMRCMISPTDVSVVDFIKLLNLR